METVRTCNKCNVEKQLGLFKTNVKCAGGYEKTCKDCVNAQNRARRAGKNNEKTMSQDVLDYGKFKHCITCKVNKPLVDFEVCYSNPDKRTVSCKSCRNETMKSCSRCAEIKLLNEFDSNGNGGFRSECKACRKTTKVSVDQKACSICGIVKNADEFGIDTCQPSGLRSACKVCRNKPVENITEKLAEVKINDFKQEVKQDINTKTCNRCSIAKPNEEFPFSNKSLGTRAGICKACKNSRSKEHYQEVKNDDHYKTVRKNYRETNKDHIAQLNCAWSVRNRDYLNNKERERRKNDIAFRLEKDLRRTMNKFYDKEGRTFNYIGCSREQLVDWFNYQSNIDDVDLTSDYHIDHVIPCNAFDLTTEEEQRKCFNWSNLRLCSAKENLAKNGKIDIELINNQVDKVNCYIEEKQLNIDKTYLIKSR